MSTTAISTNAAPVAAPRLSALAIMASRCNVEPAKLHATLKNTVFKGASDDEMLALVVVANEYGLNPLLKELYAFPAKGGGIVPVVSVDGWIRMMNSHPQMDGIEHEFHEDDKGALISCTTTIWRKDRTRPIKVTEYLSECRRNTDPWKMEHRMLRNKSLIQCNRVAFGFSGVQDEDEARDTAMRDVTPRAETPPPPSFAQASVTAPTPPVMEATVEAPADAAADTQDSATSPPLTADDLKQWMEATGITIQEMRTWLYNQHHIKSKTTTLSSLPPETLAMLNDQWSTVIEDIREARSIATPA